MARLVIVANRVALPRERGARAGGVAVALRDALQRRGGLWFGWSGRVLDPAPPDPAITASHRTTYATFDLSSEDHQAFYLGYANSTLWPLFHYRLGLIEFRRSDSEGYLRVNAGIAKSLAQMLKADDALWVHDYHMIPLGAELRKLGFAGPIGFFLHIPFPAMEVLLALPDHRRLVESMFAYDLIGFQTERDVRSFGDYVVNEAGGHVAGSGVYAAFGRRARVGAFPIGIDTEPFAAQARAAASAPETVRVKDSLGGRALLIGVDRLDYSKGLPLRLDAYHELLSRRPEYRNKVAFMQIAPLSRGDVAQYRALRRELEAKAGRINGKFADADWTPVRYLNKPFPRQTLAGFFRLSRVGVVTPLRDGMNLVAKEYVAAQDPDDPGVLVLSRFAGAMQELPAAVIVNPFDIDQVADALHKGLTMPADERRSRWESMMTALRHNTIATWRDRFLAALDQAAIEMRQPELVLPEPCGVAPVNP